MKKEPKNELGSALRAYRKRNKLTLDKTAKLLNVPLTSVWQWETGRCSPNGRNWTNVMELVNNKQKA